MNIAIDKVDAVTLAFCMDIMKGNCKENLRKNLGIREGKKKFKLYKSVLKALDEQLIIEMYEPEIMMNFECTTEQSEVVREFILSFLELLEDEERQEEKKTYAPKLENVLSSFLIAEADSMAAVI